MKILDGTANREIKSRGSDKLEKAVAYGKQGKDPLPEEAVFEVGGLDWLEKEKNRLLVCTRRGEVWVVDNPYAVPPTLVPVENGTKQKRTLLLTLCPIQKKDGNNESIALIIRDITFQKENQTSTCCC